MLDSATLHKKTSLIHPESPWWWQPSWILTWFPSKTTILDSATLHKTLTQTNSIWLKLIHWHLTWWYQPSWIVPSSNQPFCTKKTSLIHSDSIWWWHTILNSAYAWIQPLCTKLCIQTPCSIWLKLIHSHSNWWLSLHPDSWLQTNSAILNSKNLHSFIGT